MNSDELARITALLAAEHRVARAPVGLEQVVLAEFDASRRRRRGWAFAAAAGSIAATLAAGTVLIREKPAPPPTVVATASPKRFEAPALAVARKPILKTRPWTETVSPPPNSVESPFIAIPYTVPIAPEENVTVMRMTISPSAMAAAGFPLPAIDPGLGTEADVLVGEDGRARAIRIVESSNFR